MTYKHPKFDHTQEVQEFETVRRQLLEDAGWVLVKPKKMPEAKMEPAATAETAKMPEAEPTKPKTAKVH
jgi:hypothetical protein